MPSIELDSTLQRTIVDGFAYPMGVYPVEPTAPTPGVFMQFEAADGAEPFLSGDEPAFDDWEAWPDRYMFDILMTADRIPSLVRSLLTLLPPRVFPILDVLGHDAYREIDPYVAYDAVGLDKVIEGIRVYSDWLFEDGLVGFGAMSIDPFVYVFVDEHKIVTVRAEVDLKEKVERLLEAYELEPVEDVLGADSTAHEHRSVLFCPPERSDLLTPEEVVERLRREWLLQLNVQGDTNIDDDGKDLGVTAWRCVLRCIPSEEGQEVYAEVFLTAPSLDEAERLATEIAVQTPPSEEGWYEVDPVQCDRVLPDAFGKMLSEYRAKPAGPLSSPAIHHVVWHRAPDQGDRPKS